MQELFEMVKEFNNSFGIEYSDKPKADIKDFMLRHNLMEEENTEYLTATTIEEVSDALVDQMYILIGTILKHGLQDKFIVLFKEVHRSNMTKLDENGIPIIREDGKILKGENYSEPNLTQFLK